MESKHTKFDIFLTIIAVLYNITLITIALFWIFTNTFDTIKINWFVNTLNEQNLLVFSYFFFAGQIGGAAYCLRAVYTRLADAYNEKKAKKENYTPRSKFNIQVWFFWYMYRPLQGAILSVILICLFNQGLLTMNGIKESDMSSIYFQVAIGFLVGFGSSEVTDKIEELIKVIFSRSSKKQSINGNSSNQPPTSES